MEHNHGINGEWAIVLGKSRGQLDRNFHAVSSAFSCKNVLICMRNRIGSVAQKLPLSGLHSTRRTCHPRSPPILRTNTTRFSIEAIRSWAEGNLTLPLFSSAFSALFRQTFDDQLHPGPIIHALYRLTLSSVEDLVPCLKFTSIWEDNRAAGLLGYSNTEDLSPEMDEDEERKYQDLWRAAFLRYLCIPGHVDVPAIRAVLGDDADNEIKKQLNNLLFRPRAFMITSMSSPFSPVDLDEKITIIYDHKFVNTLKDGMPVSGFLLSVISTLIDWLRRWAATRPWTSRHVIVLFASLWDRMSRRTCLMSTNRGCPELKYAVISTHGFTVTSSA